MLAITRPTFVLAAAGAVCLLALPPTARSTQVKPMTTRAVLDGSTRAVWAKCTAVESKEVAQYGGNIFTFSTFHVLKRIRGEIGDTFTIRLLGGHLGDTAVEVPMTPIFTASEEVILLLGPDNADGYPVIFIQGVLRTKTDTATGVRVITTPVTGMQLYHVADGSPYQSVPATVPVDDFIYSTGR